MGQTLERYEKRILRVSVAVMERLGFMELTISRLAEVSQQPIDRIRCSFESDDSLRIQTMKYAALIWCSELEEKAGKIIDTDERVMFVIEQYAFGTDMYQGALSCYIDAWYHILRHSIGEVEKESLKHSLVEIYNIFENTLISVMAEIHPAITDISMYVWLLVIISDSIHIQRMLGRHINREEVCSRLFKLIMQQDTV